MEEFNFDTIKEWLGITEQQLQVIKAIYRLETGKTETTPKNITREYARTHGKTIQKPNLFTILRTLIEKELIKKDGHSSYRVDFDGIRGSLHAHKDKLAREREEFQKAYGRTEDYFRKHVAKSQYPSVSYHEHDELYAEITKSISNSDTFNIVASFPCISYTYNIAVGVNLLEYAETLWRRCFKEKSLEVNYLTTLDIDYLFNQAFRSLEDPKLAFRECELVLKQLANQAETQPKLSVRVAEEQKGMSICLPLREKAAEFYLLIKDEHKEVLGGIKIRSPETSYQAENMFNLGFNYAEELTQKAVDKALKKLKQEYGILE